MGFRSTFITEDYYVQVPNWFREKYQSWVFMDEKGFLPIASKVEVKTYMRGKELEKDIQKVIIEDKKFNLDFIVLVWLHECGGITRVEIHKDKILYSEPQEWKQVEDVTHNYCYGCSDIATYLTKDEK